MGCGQFGVGQRKGGEEHSEGEIRLAFLWRYDIFI